MWTPFPSTSRSLSRTPRPPCPSSFCSPRAWTPLCPCVSSVTSWARRRRRASLSLFRSVRARSPLRRRRSTACTCPAAGPCSRTSSSWRGGCPSSRRSSRASSRALTQTSVSSFRPCRRRSCPCPSCRTRSSSPTSRPRASKPTCCAPTCFSTMMSGIRAPSSRSSSRWSLLSASSTQSSASDASSAPSGGTAPTPSTRVT
mmetsp:Transcript_20170/g.49750  ORF Transcript_20170/g.49750 Transcript_20170/m.49750 type:complete len:201 (-) Transcript_20170:54-656(-)